MSTETTAQDRFLEKSLFDLFRDLRDAKFYILGGILAFLVAGFVFLSFATPYYSASIILSPASPIGQNSYKMSQPSDPRLWQSQSVRNYPDFIRFENKYSAPSVARLLLEDKAIYEGLAKDKAFVFSSVDLPRESGALAAYLSRRVRLEPVGNTPLRRLTYYHPDPVFASYLLTRLHHITDMLIRQGIRIETQERIAYLQDALIRTANPDHRRALTDLLMEQERLRMLVSIEQPYAASVVEPSAPSVKPEWPDFALVLVVFSLLGAVFGFIIFGFRSSHG